jgi:ELWxxDGT repeat protein
VAVKQPTESLAVQRAEAPANTPYVLADDDFYPTNIKPYSLTSFAGRLFFLANNDPNNQSSLILYSVAEDGSDVRRELGEDVTFVQNLTVVGDTLYFYADRSINAANFTRHVYAYDGTTLQESGDFPEGLFASRFYATSLGLFVVTTNNVYRTAFEDGEFTFASMHPGDTMTTYTGVKSRTQFGELFTEVEGTIYFVADTVIDGTAVGEELWKTDGSAEGTSLALETNDLTTGDNLSSAPRPLLARYANAPLVSGEVAGKLLFSAYDNSPTPKLHAYISDGTAEGTVKLLELPNQSRRGL